MLSDLAYDTKVDTRGKKLERIGDGEDASSLLQSMKFWCPSVQSGKAIPSPCLDVHQRAIQETSSWKSFTETRSALPERQLGVLSNPDRGTDGGDEENLSMRGKRHEPEAWLAQLPGPAEIGDEVPVLNGCTTIYHSRCGKTRNQTPSVFLAAAMWMQ